MGSGLRISVFSEPSGLESRIYWKPHNTPKETDVFTQGPARLDPRHQLAAPLPTMGSTFREGHFCNQSVERKGFPHRPMKPLGHQTLGDFAPHHKGSEA